MVVGVNDFTESEPSPLGGGASILVADPAVEDQIVHALAVRKPLRPGPSPAEGELDPAWLGDRDQWSTEWIDQY